MIEIINTILDKMEKICKPQRKFITGMLAVMLSARGKMTFRNMSRYSNFSEKTFARNYEKSFNFAEFNQQALTLVLKPGARVVAAFDPSFIQKSGKKTFGKDYFWNGSGNKAEKGLEIGLLAVVDVDYNTAYAISAQQTPPIAASRKHNDMPITEESRVDAYLEHIKKNREYLPSEVKHLVVDGFFGKEKFITSVKNMNLDLVGKLRIDANMRHPYHGEQSGIGRPKKYDKKVDINDLSQLQFDREVQFPQGQIVKLYTAIVNSVSLKRKIKIVLLFDDSNKDKIYRSLLFSTDLNLSALDICTFYKSRYQIEFVFRDAKQFTGLTDSQARSKEKLDWHFNASFMALNVTKITDRRNKENANIEGPFSMASWKARCHNENLIDKVFSMLDIDPTLIKLTPEFEKLRNYGAVSYVN